MSHHPADVAGGEHGFAGVAAVDVLHGRGQRHRIAAYVSLHTLGRAGGTRGEQNVRRLVRFQPHHRHLRIHVLRAQRGVIEVAAGDDGHVVVEPAIHQYHFFRRKLRQTNGLVEQVLVRHRLAAPHAAIRRDNDLGFCIVDAGGETA